jgi:hypothetical protein
MTNDEFGNGNSSPGKEPGKGDESGGLGNLPPLSDFDSGEASDLASDSGLPPLSSFDSDPEKDSKASGFDGLPSLDDINVETPRPAGGNIKPAPPGFEEFNSPPPDSAEKTGFQDLSADSDFSPATPQVGPGPDSDMDTPMLDSAFGAAGSGGGFSPTFETPAPTQAMETPMFGETPKPPAETPEPAFDDGAFSPGGGFDVGTPMPDFSPDTAPPVAKATPVPGKAPGKVKKAKAPGGAKGKLATAGMLVAALVVGIIAGPYVSNSLAFLPNPLKSVVADKEKQIAELDGRVKKLMATSSVDGQPAVSQEMIDQLLAQKEQLDKDIADLTGRHSEAQAALDTTAQQLEGVRTDLEAQNEEFVTAQEAFENLKNETAIVTARKMGVAAEVEQLTGMVGKLDEANQRSRATKDALEHSVERMAVEIGEGIPLTPEKYSRTARLAAVEDLMRQVAEAKWVTPSLLDAYTTLYNRELEIAASTAYFFAKIPVTSKLGDTREKWAECLMKGNSAVYYRTLDGKNVGIYEKIEREGAPAAFGFREDLPEPLQKSIAEEVMLSRTEGFEEQLRTLAEKQKLIDGVATPVQRVFNSLN